MGDGRELPDESMPDGITDDALLQMFREMVLLRTFDERAVALQRQGRIGNYPPFWGEEATQVGPVMATDNDDWLFPSYRQQALPLLRGVPISTPLKYRRGLGGSHGFWDVRKHRVAPICIPIGTHLPHAVGLAWAAKIRGDGVASVVWFGEGATSEGDFHEALNFAAVFKVATIFLCTNNQWAISTPFERQTATSTVAEKASAYGVPGVRVDGFDVIACHHATVEALARARAGEGPTLIEAFCYRIKGHATADDPSRYRDASEAERWAHLEPLARTSGFLRRRGLLDDATEQAMRAEATEKVSGAVREMESIERPSSDILFEPVYAGAQPWTLSEHGRGD
jgi:pyruvate dehydrogenase E1 component alpha subunit